MPKKTNYDKNIMPIECIRTEFMNLLLIRLKDSNTKIIC